jgi:hypothetical protein
MEAEVLVMRSESVNGVESGGSGADGGQRLIVWASFGGRRRPNRVRLREIGRMTNQVGIKTSPKKKKKSITTV